MEKVSIIVPVYNVCQYIDKCLESLVCQTYTSIEIILIDDGSTDGSGEKCDVWAEKDNRIKVIHKENGGVASARNAGFDHATGVYLMSADPDDYCEITFVEKMYHAITEQDCDLAVCSYFAVYANEMIKWETTYETGIYSMEEVFSPLFFATNATRNKRLIAAFWAGILKRDIVEKNGLRCDTNVTWAEDYLFYAEYIGYCKRVAVMNESLYYYVQRKSSLMHTQQQPSGLSVIQSTLYILTRLQQIIHKHKIDEALYLQPFYEKYAKDFLRRIIYVCSHKHKAGRAERRSLIKYILTETEISEVLKKVNVSALPPKLRMTAMVVKTRNIFFIHLWAEVFNLLKALKSLLKPYRAVD